MDTTMAQAVGEEPWRSPAFVAGVDFDPHDEDDVAAVRAAGEVHRAEYVRELEEKVDRLTAIVYGSNENEGEQHDESE